MLHEINESRDFLLTKGFDEPEIGIVLGTGLHQLIQYMDVKATISYANIPHFPVSTVEFHKGNLVYGTIAGKNVIIMQGRFHSYEGYSMQQLNIDLKKGVYVAVQGPNLETKAEYRFLKIIGADMVGMSTIPEVIAAVHMQLPCVAVSVITDECDPDNLKPVNIKEIIEVAGKADIRLSQLFVEVIKAFE